MDPLLVLLFQLHIDLSQNVRMTGYKYVYISDKSEYIHSETLPRVSNVQVTFHSRQLAGKCRVLRILHALFTESLHTDIHRMCR